MPDENTISFEERLTVLEAAYRRLRTDLEELQGQAIKQGSKDWAFVSQVVNKVDNEFEALVKLVGDVSAALNQSNELVKRVEALEPRLEILEERVDSMAMSLESTIDGLKNDIQMLAKHIKALIRDDQLPPAPLHETDFPVFEVFRAERWNPEEKGKFAILRGSGSVSRGFFTAKQMVEEIQAMYERGEFEPRGSETKEEFDLIHQQEKDR